MPHRDEFWNLGFIERKRQAADGLDSGACRVPLLESCWVLGHEPRFGEAVKTG